MIRVFADNVEHLFGDLALDLVMQDRAAAPEFTSELQEVLRFRLINIELRLIDIQVCRSPMIAGDRDSLEMAWSVSATIYRAESREPSEPRTATGLEGGEPRPSVL